MTPTSTRRDGPPGGTPPPDPAHRLFVRGAPSARRLAAARAAGAGLGIDDILTLAATVTEAGEATRAADATEPTGRDRAVRSS
ncbi:hypothetical protein ABZ567_12485 [Streptomyces sp. NPDC016459]|uniref:hypothetical protein n=1 Tax=Streptomyces sp. NPDC016459 TaxID=3157190 RepID=UPI003411073E